MEKIPVIITSNYPNNIPSCNCIECNQELAPVIEGKEQVSLVVDVVKNEI